MKKGFTLIEVLIVVLIIGILAAIALPQYQMSTMKTRYTNLMTLTKAIAAANERYYMAQGAYATNFDALDIALPEGGQSGTYGSYNYTNYDWGFCMLIAQQSASCRSTTELKDAHIIYYDKSTSTGNTGRTICYALSADTSDKYNKICQSFTNKTTPEIASSCVTLAGYLTCNGYYF